MIFPVVWIGLVIGLSQAANWVIEQGVMEGSIRQDPGRWVISALASLAIVVPFGLLTRVKHPVYRGIFLTWSLASGVMLALTPIRWLEMTDSQGVAVVQLVVMACFNLFFSRWIKRAQLSINDEPHWFARSFLIAWIPALLLGIPWVMFGALGSWVDTLLSLVVGWAGGALAFQVVKFGLLKSTQLNIPVSRFLKGLIISQVLVILSAGLGVNGNEWIMLLVLPPLGWLAALWFTESSFTRNGFILLIGAVFFWILAWVDADELALVISMDEGELLGWIITSSLVTFFTVLFLIFLGYLGKKLFWERHVKPGWIAVVIGTILVVLLSLYFWRGSPGLFGEKIFVVLREQADLSGISEDLPHDQRRLMVYQTLTSHAIKTQSNLRKNLKKFGIPFTPYYLVNAIEVDAGPLVRLWLSFHPEVDHILDNPILRPLPEPVPHKTNLGNPPESVLWNLKLIGAERVWDELRIRGEGVVVGQSDSGVQGDHPEFSSNYLGNGIDGNFTWLDMWNQSLTPVDIGGHGTHTLGTIVGKNVGVAPGAKWIGCVNLARNLGNMAVYLNCLQYMLAPYPHQGDPFEDGVPTRGAQILNNSWGCPKLEGCDAHSMLPAVQALKKAGVYVVVSAGNSGLSGCESVDSPLAIYEEVLTVGAIDRNGEITDFSSLGPVTVDGSNRIKPDLLAPGQGIYSAFPGSGYNLLSGTSMAGPHVAGVVALMWSANPKLVGNVDLTTDILRQTAKRYNGMALDCDGGKKQQPSNTSGYGVVDAYAAVKAALEIKP